MRALSPLWSSLNALFSSSAEDKELAFFKEVKLFEDLTPWEIKKVMKLMHVRTFKDGEYIFHKGQPGAAFYVIRSGHIKVVQPGDEMLVIAELAAGDLIGELSILDDTPRSASALTEGRAELRAIFKHDFDKLVYNEPVIAAKIYRRVAIIVGIRLKATNEQLLQSVRKAAEYHEQ